MPNEPASRDGRRGATPTLRGALLWAVVGAALFLGVGAALPVWERAEIFVGQRAPLWQVIRLRMEGADRYAYLGYMVYEPGYGDLIAGSARLLAFGAAVGLLGYCVRLGVNEWKGGGA